MPQINQLSSVGNVSAGDQIPVYAPANGDARKMSVSQLIDYFQDNFTSPTVSVNIYAPLTGQTISAPDPSTASAQTIWMLLQPAGTLATFTIILPLPSATPDGTEILISSTQQITAFTLNGNGATVNGAPAGMSANASMLMRFVQSQNSWYNITRDSTFVPSLTVASSITALSGSFSGVLSANSINSTTSIATATMNASSNVSISGTLGAGATTAASVTSAGSQLVNGTGKQGYTTGAGGSVTQAITGSKTAGVTLNKATGFIELDPTGLIAAGGTVKFTLTNSTITARDVVVLNYAPNSVGAGATSGAYGLNARVSNAGGSCDISITNLTAGGLTEALWINFAVISGASA